MLTPEELNEWIRDMREMVEGARHLAWVSGGLAPLRKAHEAQVKRLRFLEAMQAAELAK
jgi:hypothetical protein